MKEITQKDIDYCSRIMAELYMQHNYRLMYDLWIEKVKPMMEEQLKQNYKAKETK
jgi:hypothetical protein